MNRFKCYLPIVFSLAFTVSVSASPVGVTLRDAQYTTFVSRGVWGIEGLNLESRTNESGMPIADSLVSETAWLNSRAEASLFRISSYAASDYPLHDLATASADAKLTFSPIASAVVPLSIEVTGWGHWYFSIGSVALYDVTAGTTLWNYEWNGQSGTMPWLEQGSEEPRGSAVLTIDTELLESHDYRLTLFSWVNSQEPSAPHIQMQVKGIEVVPEPSAIAFLSLAGLALVVFRRSKGSVAGAPLDRIGDEEAAPREALEQSEDWTRFQR